MISALKDCSGLDSLEPLRDLKFTLILACVIVLLFPFFVLTIAYVGSFLRSFVFPSFFRPFISADPTGTFVSFFPFTLRVISKLSRDF